jgi:hypothetical protein
MRYRLCTLLIVLALGPPVLAACWPAIKARYVAWQWRQAVQAAEQVQPFRSRYVLGSEVSD